MFVNAYVFETIKPAVLHPLPHCWRYAFINIFTNIFTIFVTFWHSFHPYQAMNMWTPTLLKLYAVQVVINFFKRAMWTS